MELIKRFLSKDAGPIVQFVKYAIAGGMATLTHIVTFFVLGWRLFPCLTEDDIMVRLLKIKTTAPKASKSRAINAAIATAIAFLISNAMAYLLNVLFVFDAGKHDIVIEIALFYAVSGISIVIGTSLQTLLIARYGIMTTLAFGSNIVSALLINYAMRKFFIFNG